MASPQCGDAYSVEPPGHPLVSVVQVWRAN
jgi:hypothetical protein